MIGCHCAVCTSPDPRDSRSRPSIVVSYDNHNILVDTTPELRLQAVRERLDRVDAVVYTHAHADHVFGMDDVRRYNTVMEKPLPLYATQVTMDTLRSCFPYAFVPPPTAEKRTDSLYRPELVPTIIDGPFELHGKTWTPVELVHGRFIVQGFRIGDFAYCTDCNQIPDASKALLQGLDALIIDALRPRPHPTHLSFEQALAIVDELKPKRAFFTHLSHDMKHADIEAALPSHVRVGFDGLKITSL